MDIKIVRYLISKIKQAKDEAKQEIASELQIKTLDGNSLQGSGDIPLKTINGNHIIGYGDISAGGGTFSGTLDDIPDGATYKKVIQAEKDNWNSKADGSHNHNDIYYTESEIDGLLLNKANVIHNHNLADLSEKSYNSLTDKPDLTSLHTHNNKALLDSYTQTESDLADAVSQKHSHSNLELLDTYKQTEEDLESAVLQRHSHSNQTLLDSLTSSGDGTQFLANDGTYKTPSGGGGVGQLVIPIHSNAAGNLVLTNQANAEQFLGNSNRNIIKVNLTNYTQVRLTARVVTASASVNSPRLYVEYSANFSTSLAAYQSIGTTVVGIPLSPATLADSGWVNLVSGAKADVFIAILQNGGDGAADPALGQIHLHFR